MREIPKSLSLYVGCAGWSLPHAVKHRFPERGSLLVRYAARFPAVEINSSFYRPHRVSTYAKWAESVPSSFRFCVKMPKSITHEHQLSGVRKLLSAFIDEVGGLGKKLGCLLVQLAPSHGFRPRVTSAFFTELRRRHAGPVVLEPRHASWFTADTEKLLLAFSISRVAADPARVPAAAEPSGWPEVAYYRLHGSPRMYYSAYTDDYLGALAPRLERLAATKTPVWCIFDNTALGAAYVNAFDLMHRLHPKPQRHV